MFRNVSKSNIRFNLYGTILLLVLLLSAQSFAQTFSKVDGIVYRKIGDIELRLDIVKPNVEAEPFPVIIFLCGNGWGYYGINRTLYDYAAQFAASKGYAGVPIDYSSTAQKFIFPSQLFDVKCALRWLRANADTYHLDPNRIAVLGWSSGGNLALMLALTGPSDGLEGDCEYSAYSSAVQAVVNIAGPTELVRAYRTSSNPYDKEAYMGGTPETKADLYRQASPLNYIKKLSPPILTIQGDDDKLVPQSQAELLDKLMKEKGGSHTLIIKKGYGHENLWREPEVWTFLESQLKK